MEDHVVDQRYSQPLVDLDEFESRISWSFRCFSENGIKIVYVFPHCDVSETREEKGERWDPRITEEFAMCVEVISAEYSAWTVRSESMNFSGLLAKRAVNDLAEILLRYGKMWKIGLPEGGEIETVSGKKHPLRAGDILTVYVSCYGQRERGGIDEGAGITGRSLEKIGGSNEFDRTLQIMILDELERNWLNQATTCMIIGDSIRMRICNSTGYVRHAYRALLVRVNLVHVPHNCGGSKVGEANVDNWMTARPDIVFYNAGLHDLALYPYGSAASSDDEPFTELYSAGPSIAAAKLTARRC